MDERFLAVRGAAGDMKDITDVPRYLCVDN